MKLITENSISAQLLFKLILGYSSLNLFKKLVESPLAGKTSKHIFEES